MFCAMHICRQHAAAPAVHPMHMPLPLQTLPPLSLHMVPDGASMTPHALFWQVLFAQSVDCAGQSATVLHWTHLPPPSQTLPPLSSHGVPCGALGSSHMLIKQK